MATADSFHGKEGTLTIEYPDRIQYKDVTTATNDHYAFTDAATVPDADPETALAGAEYSDANYQTIGVDNTSTVDKTTSTNTFYAMHYLKIQSPSAAANITKIEVRVHGTSNQGGSLTDGWSLKLWDASGNTWNSVASTTAASETELVYTITSATDVTIAEALAASDYLYLCAQAATASDGASASNMNIAFVEVLFWYARTVAYLKGFTFRILKEIEELKTQDSVLRADVIQKNLGIEVEFTRAKFDGRLMAELMGKLDMDQDIDGSTSAGKSRASVKDTSGTLKCTLRGTLTSGSNVIKIRADNVVFDGFNLDIPEDGWVMQPFKGTGDAAYLQYST